MIISYRHRFIFLHCRKVAGSAMQIHLARFLGPDDILLGTRDDLEQHGVKQTRRFRRDVFGPTGLRALGRRFLRKPAVMLPGRIHDTLGRVHKEVYEHRLGPFSGHAPAAHIRRFDPRAWNDFFKFCFVRNPYERAVSDYLWRIRSRGHDLDFRQFLEQVHAARQQEPAESPRHDNWPIYTINDEIVADEVGRYENLTEDFGRICARIGVPAEGLPVAKKVVQSYDYRSYYGEREKELVADIYGHELKTFGYTF